MSVMVSGFFFAPFHFRDFSLHPAKLPVFPSQPPQPPVFQSIYQKSYNHCVASFSLMLESQFL